MATNIQMLTLSSAFVVVSAVSLEGTYASQAIFRSIPCVRVETGEVINIDYLVTVVTAQVRVGYIWQQVSRQFSK